MITKRKVAKGFAWSLGSILALAVVLYLIALLVNLRDRPPSETALKLSGMLEAREQIPDSDNAYIFLLGFSAPEGMDPQVAGAQRLSWLKERGYASESNRAEPFAYAKRHSDRPHEIEQLRHECRAVTLRCAMAFEKNAGEISEWLTSQPILLERYRALLTRRAWLELVPDDVAFPLPLYGDVTEGQRVYLVSLWLSSDQLGAVAVRHALQADLTFWREVLASTDLLISKMIAVAAIRQHFALGNLVLRRMPPEMMLETIPSSWQEEITADERSMMRVMAGEFEFVDGMLRGISLPSSARGEAATELGFIDLLLLPMFQHQDSLNRLATRYVAAAEAFEIPWELYPEALALANVDLPATAYKRIYNVVGDILFDASGIHFGRYAVRVGDVEGMRRAALITAQLRSRAVPVEDMEEELKKAEVKNHYTGAPFEWTEEDRAVVFVGLEEGERGRHVYAY